MIDTHAAPDVRVRLINDEYMSEYGGRMAAGTAVEVDPKTAQRWLKRGIAEAAEIGDLTLRERKLAMIRQLQDEADELLTLQSSPPETVPSPVRRGPGRPPGARPTVEAGE